MTACPDDNQLARLVEGELDEPERARIERHLDDCLRCGEVVGELAWLVAPARTAPVRFRLLRPVGGDAWLAEDRAGGGTVAVRFVTRPAARAAEHAAALAGARAAVGVDHANLRPVVAAGEHDGALYVAEPLAPGVTATAWCASTPRTADAIVRVWRQAVAAVAALHRAGAIHGALAPDHILVGDGDAVVVGGVGALAVPASGLVAPERLHGAPPSAHADQFALCAAAWEALVERRPFTGATVGALAVQMTAPPAAPADGPRHVLAVLARGLAPDPTRRWPDLDALAAALARPPPRRRGPLVAVLVAGAIAVAATAIALLV